MLLSERSTLKEMSTLNSTLVFSVKGWLPLPNFAAQRHLAPRSPAGVSDLQRPNPRTFHHFLLAADALWPR